MTPSTLAKRMFFSFFIFFTFAVLTKFTILRIFCDCYTQCLVGSREILALILISTLSSFTLLLFLSKKELSMKLLILRSCITTVLSGSVVFIVSDYMGWLRRAPIESTIIVVTAIILAMALVLTIDLNLAKLEKAVYIDPLTKAFNRRYFMEVAAATLAACTKVEREFALIMLDIDHFKRINDTYGHLVGDEVLKTTFARISHSLAGDTVIARIGGEEFVVLVTDAEKADVIGIAQRIQKNLSATMFHIGDVIIAVTASFGIASRNPGNISLEKILENSDTALYRAKASGRNAIVHFDGNL